jgi:hypothetical protein
MEERNRYQQLSGWSNLHKVADDLEPIPVILQHGHDDPESAKGV